MNSSDVKLTIGSGLLDLFLNQGRHLTNALEILNLTKSEPDIELTLDSKYQVDIGQRVPARHFLSRGLPRDTQSWIVEDIAKNGLEPLDQCVHGCHALLFAAVEIVGADILRMH